jgi:hypothetical protein
LKILAPLREKFFTLKNKRAEKSPPVRCYCKQCFRSDNRDREKQAAERYRADQARQFLHGFFLLYATARKGRVVPKKASLCFCYAVQIRQKRKIFNAQTGADQLQKTQPYLSVGGNFLARSGNAD